MSEYEAEGRIYDPAFDKYALPGDTEPRPFEATDGVKKVYFPSMGAFRALVQQVKDIRADVAALKDQHDDLREALTALEAELFEDDGAVDAVDAATKQGRL